MVRMMVQTQEAASSLHLLKTLHEKASSMLHSSLPSQVSPCLDDDPANPHLLTHS